MHQVCIKESKSLCSTLYEGSNVKGLIEAVLYSTYSTNSLQYLQQMTEYMLTSFLNSVLSCLLSIIYNNDLFFRNLCVQNGND